jgi:2-phosphosulfolactate phosphatase
MTTGVYDQSAYGVRFEWGLPGLQALIAPGIDAVVIVDVLSFTTAVDIATSRGAQVYPCGWRDGSATRIATSVAGVVAGTSAAEGARLSPSTLLGIAPGTRLVLESVNGSALAHAVPSHIRLYAASLRNAGAVARRLSGAARIAVIAAGERWADGSLRPALEDLLGAGSVLAALAGDLSPEATIAADAFEANCERIAEQLRNCTSGREKIARRAQDDIELAAELDVSVAVPQLADGAFRSAPAAD